MPGSSGAQGPRLLIVGDSITQGLEGDLTWRYRLWEHLAGCGQQVTFTGPGRGTFALPAELEAGHAYPAPNDRGAYRDHRRFPCRHGAKWGDTLRLGHERIGPLVAEYRPDVLLLMIGYNDLAWNGDQDAEHAAAVTGADLLTYLDKVVAAIPEAPVILLGSSPYHREGGGLDPLINKRVAAYNRRLPGVLDGFRARNPGVPLHLVRLDSRYDPDHSYDGIHADPLGECQMASAYADALARCGIGEPYRMPSRPLPVPLGAGRAGAVTAEPTGPGTLRVRWPHVFGASGYWVWLRDLTDGGEWTHSFLPVQADSWDIWFYPAGHELEITVLTCRGDAASGGGWGYSPVRRVTVPTGEHDEVTLTRPEPDPPECAASSPGPPGVPRVPVGPQRWGGRTMAGLPGGH
jgi:lysophospholipase L1-like esterase